MWPCREALSEEGLRRKLAVAAVMPGLLCTHGEGVSASLEVLASNEACIAGRFVARKHSYWRLSEEQRFVAQSKVGRIDPQARDWSLIRNRDCLAPR